MARGVINRYFCLVILLFTFINVSGNNISFSKNDFSIFNESTSSYSFQNQESFSFTKNNSHKEKHNGNLVEIIEIQEIVEEYTPSNESDFINFSNQYSYHFHVLFKELITLKKHKYLTFTKPTLRLHLLYQVYII